MENKTVIQELKTGTTTVGLITKDSVVLAADMRASLGNIAYDEESDKISEINEYMALTNAGSVADSVTIIKFLRSQAKLFEIEREERMTPRAAASLLSNVLNANRYYPFIVQLVIGGIGDKPELHEVTPFGGGIERKTYAATGSGTDYALTTLDQNYSPDMTQEEGIRLAIKAIEAGKKRDIYSGGVSVTVVVVDSNGTRRLKDEEVKKYTNNQKQVQAKTQQVEPPKKTFKKNFN